MNNVFSETLRRLREERGLSQAEIGKQLFVDHSAVARWENGSRLPDAVMILRIANCLGVNANLLFQSTILSDDSPNVIIVDDNKIILSDGIAILGEVMPNATIAGFIWPLEAIEYAKINRIALAVLDIELGTSSGLDLCDALLQINPCTNIVFLTAYSDYALNAWKTEASGFMLKPLSAESVREQLKKLRYPFPIGGTGE